ncbi:MAG: amidohydrolase family protein [Microthrixaceae bacterium]
MSQTSSSTNVQATDLIIISVDDHVVEPPDMFEGRLSAKYADRAPRVIENALGQEMWLFEELRPQLRAQRRIRPTTGGVRIEPTRFDEIRRGCWDVDSRVEDMNAGGVLASLNFPSFPQFCGQIFANTADKDLALAILQAYNDWHIEDWAGAYPDRFIPLALIPYWDPQLMAQRSVQCGQGGACDHVVREPRSSACPASQRHWDPFWRACDRPGMVLCLHIGSSSAVKLPSVEAPFMTMMNFCSQPL